MFKERQTWRVPCSGWGRQFSNTVLPKVFASWLIILVLAPFTAPFSTCDLPSLAGSAPAKHNPLALPGSVALTTDAAVPRAPYVPARSRVRPLQLSRSPLTEWDRALSSATVVGGMSVGTVREHVALTRILRLWRRLASLVD